MDLRDKHWIQIVTTSILEDVFSIYMQNGIDQNAILPFKETKLLSRKIDAMTIFDLKEVETPEDLLFCHKKPIRWKYCFKNGFWKVSVVFLVKSIFKNIFICLYLFT